MAAIRPAPFSLLALVLLVSCSGLWIPPASAVDTIVVDMPHGWWRVSIHSDGSANYGFGALAQTGAVARGTFDFESLHADLAPRITREIEPKVEEYGTVQFCVDGEGCGDLWYLTDRSFANEVLDRAFENRIETEAGFGLGSSENSDAMWREREQE